MWIHLVHLNPFEATLGGQIWPWTDFAAPKMPMELRDCTTIDQREVLSCGWRRKRNIFEATDSYQQPASNHSNVLVNIILNNIGISISSHLVIIITEISNESQCTVPINPSLQTICARNQLLPQESTLAGWYQRIYQDLKTYLDLPWIVVYNMIPNRIGKSIDYYIIINQKGF